MFTLSNVIESVNDHYRKAKQALSQPPWLMKTQSGNLKKRKRKKKPTALQHCT
jgi:hypothetical protein